MYSGDANQSRKSLRPKSKILQTNNIMSQISKEDIYDRNNTGVYQNGGFRGSQIKYVPGSQKHQSNKLNNTSDDEISPFASAKKSLPNDQEMQNLKKELSRIQGLLKEKDKKINQQAEELMAAAQCHRHEGLVAGHRHRRAGPAAGQAARSESQQQRTQQPWMARSRGHLEQRLLLRRMLP